MRPQPPYVQAECEFCVALSDSPNEPQQLVCVVLFQGSIVCEFGKLEVCMTAKRLPGFFVDDGQPLILLAPEGRESLYSCCMTIFWMILCLECIKAGGNWSFSCKRGQSRWCGTVRWRHAGIRIHAWIVKILNEECIMSSQNTHVVTSLHRHSLHQQHLIPSRMTLRLRSSCRVHSLCNPQTGVMLKGPTGHVGQYQPL